MGYKKKGEENMSHEWKHPNYYKELVKYKKELEENSKKENNKEEENNEENR